VYPANIIKLLRNTKVNPRMDKKTVNLAELLGSGDTGNHETQNPENVKKALDNLICWFYRICSTWLLIFKYNYSW